MVFLDPIIRFQLQRAAEHLCVLGPRCLAELLSEIGTAANSMPLIVERAVAYQQLDPAVVRAIGGDRFPHLSVVPPR